tara:strand:+ start:484 stop:690 length:207 start_codon:yes stop_codon:yes gene_type:complete
VVAVVVIMMQQVQHQEVLVEVEQEVHKPLKVQLVRMELQTLAVAVVQQLQEVVQAKVQQCKEEMVVLE